MDEVDASVPLTDIAGAYGAPWKTTRGRSALPGDESCGSAGVGLEAVVKVQGGTGEITSDPDGQPSEDPSLVGIACRRLPKMDGIYVDGYLQGKEVSMTVDSGCTSTIVSTRFYNSLLEDSRPTLAPSTKMLKNADGHLISFLGQWHL